MTVLVVAVLAVVAMPAAQAQIQNPESSTPTKLYFHIFDTVNNFVVNTQAMNASFFEVGGNNFPTVPDTPVVADGGWDFNTIYGTSTAGPVEYDFIENGRPRFHPERGIAQDVRIDPDVGPVVHFFLDARDVTGANIVGPSVLPAMTVRVTVRTGDEPGSDANLDAGDVIMSGEVTAHIYDPHGYTPAPEGLALDHPVLTPDEAGVVEFVVPMDLAMDVIRKADAFNVRIDWYQLAAYGADDDTYAQGNLRVVADPDHLPRLEFAVMNPVYIDFIHPQVAAGTLLIHTGVNSPWGTYDVDVDNITLSVEGPSAPAGLERVVAQNQHVHGLHDQSAEVTYLWRFRDEGAANGEYTISMQVPNDAGTASATGRAGFTIEGKRAFGISDEGEVVEPTLDEDEASPGPGVAGLAALFMTFALARRRRP